jgi:RimJ/RimL family protein N-acetyltransferase
MPFAVAWTDEIGKSGFEEGFVAFHVGCRRSWSPGDWDLELGVYADGEPMGFQGLNAVGFAERRRVITGSWLAARYQGRGYGTEMRAAALELAFSGLGAVVAESGHLEGNVRSLRVSQKLGYTRAGEGWREPRGVPVREQKLELTRERWAASSRIPVEIEGLADCLRLFGLPAGA